MLKRFFKKFSLRIVLICYILVFTLIPSIILCSFFYSYSINNVTEQYLDSYLNTVYSQCEYNLNSMLYSLNMMFLNICSYQDLYNVIFEPSYSYEEKQEQFKVSMEKLLEGNSIISGVEIITNNNIHYCYFDHDISYVELTDNYLSGLTGNKLVLNRVIASDSDNNKFWVVGKKFYNTYNLYDVGYIVIYADEKYFERSYQSSQFKNSSFFVATDNLIISHHDKTLIGSMAMIPGFTAPSSTRTLIKNDTESFLIFNANIQNTIFAPELKVYCIISYNEVYSIVSNLNIYTFVLLLLCLIISVLVAFFLPQKLLHDVIDLKNRIAQYPSSISSDEKKLKNNEILALENSFINLTKQVNDLIKKNNEEKELKRIAELRTLQAQINPHFIYNTLDTISWMAKMEHQPKISELSTALANFFRLGLQKGESFIAIEDEIKHVKNYLKVEQFRFPNLFDVRYEIDESLTGYKMIKLLLQPLVENCVLHAFEDIGYKGLITIRVFKNSDDPDVIQFDVEDNGIGMSSDLHKFIPGSKETYNGFGLHNVEQRLLLTYGDEYGLKIESHPSKGTKISFKIKIKKL